MAKSTIWYILKKKEKNCGGWKKNPLTGEENLLLIVDLNLVNGYEEDFIRGNRETSPLKSDQSWGKNI